MRQQRIEILWHRSFLHVAEVGSQAGPLSHLLPWGLLAFPLQPALISALPQLLPQARVRTNRWKKDWTGPPLSSPDPPVLVWCGSRLLLPLGHLFSDWQEICLLFSLLSKPSCVLPSQSRLVSVSCTGEQKDPSFLLMSGSEPKPD